MDSYVKQYYNVPADVGREVTVNGKKGVITGERGPHILVAFDDDPKKRSLPCHPTWEVQYGEMGKVPKKTRSQLRYQRYLEISEMFDNFKHFLLWDAQKG